LNELWNRFPREYEHRIRTVLGNVGLTGENVTKLVGELSGGERAKLKFAILILCCGNVLFMDEPTNHLDLASKEALDTALREYKGTLLVVSHDRYLLNKFPTQIAEMNGGGITLYPGNYDAYLEQKKAREPAPQAVAAKEPPKESEYFRSKRQRSEEQARVRRANELEKQIAELETEIFRLENEMAENASDYVKLRETCDKIEENRAELDARLSEWAEIQEPQ
jgi:ATP-binding cassette subfamily F protein 3